MTSRQGPYRLGIHVSHVSYLAVHSLPSTNSPDCSLCLSLFASPSPETRNERTERTDPPLPSRADLVCIRSFLRAFSPPQSGKATPLEMSHMLAPLSRHHRLHPCTRKDSMRKRVNCIWKRNRRDRDRGRISKPANPTRIRPVGQLTAAGCWLGANWRLQSRRSFVRRP